jgi:O-methyltransferase
VGKKSLATWVKQFINPLGIDIKRYQDPDSDQAFPADFDETLIKIIREVRSYTQTSPERLCALHEAVKYVTINQIPGDIVECGVWRGGSMMAVARTLQALKAFHRHLYLFDTFEGMTQPSSQDVAVTGVTATELLQSQPKEDSTSVWCYASLAEVKASVLSTGYEAQNIHFIKGKVEETIPNSAPESISILRLDTDWYESTRHELEHLFPRLSVGGVLIIDDYGHWQGARKAVDEYIQQNKINLLLNRIDYTGRIGIKLC